jgi:hypothetical protein
MVTADAISRGKMDPNGIGVILSCWLSRPLDRLSSTQLCRSKLIRRQFAPRGQHNLDAIGRAIGFLNAAFAFVPAYLGHLLPIARDRQYRTKSAH